MTSVALRQTALTMKPSYAPSPLPAAVADVSEAAAERAAIKAVLEGDVNAFQSLVEAHQTRVYNLAYRMLGNEKEAEDAAQDAFTQAYARLRLYNPDWRFKTWMMTITSNLCIDRLRRRKIEPMSFADFTWPDSTHDADPVENLFESHEPQPDVVTVKRQQQAVLQSMLARLPPDDRSMVIMFYWDDMSYDDIVRATGLTVSAVKSRLFRARQKLAQSPLAGRL